MSLMINSTTTTTLRIRRFRAGDAGFKWVDYAC